MSEASRKYEIAKLIAIFLAWKSFLLCLAYISPGPGYDTSTVLLRSVDSTLPSKLVRWDAIYFSKVAHRGYLFEQEWAFGWGYSQFLRLIASFWGTRDDDDDFPIHEAWIGVAVSHISHLISVMALYDMSKKLFKQQRAYTRLPYLASSLHILSPAGIFLSAPYSESLFSCLSFLGYSGFVRARLEEKQSLKKDFLYLTSAIFMALASTVRSNGLLTGLLFAHEALQGLVDTTRYGVSTTRLRHLVVIGLCGCVVGVGNIGPQYLAYLEFCSAGTVPLRPWCTSFFPSIYNFVQAHYWNAGFLKYWTLPNLPLFLFAVPTIGLFVRSSIWAWKVELQYVTQQKTQPVHATQSRKILQTLALPQLALVVLIISRYHVQIITRLSSGYPVWYWWIAKSLGEHDGSGNNKAAKAAIVWMVVYGLLQGALFASFLPPA